MNVTIVFRNIKNVEKNKELEEFLMNSESDTSIYSSDEDGDSSFGIYIFYYHFWL